MFNYYCKIKNNFRILEEDKEEFEELIARGYKKLEIDEKRRFNRLLLETLFYPMLIQSPDWINVKYYLDNLEKTKNCENTHKTKIAFFEWSYESRVIHQKLTELRKEYIRVIYQDFRLIECFSALDNILLTDNLSEKDLEKLYRLINKNIKKDRRPHEIDILEKVKEEEKDGDLNYSRVFRKAKQLIQKKKKDIMALSGGQKQLIGLIRAALSEDVKGKIFLADEPTGQMDQELKKEIYNFLYKISEKNIVIVVSHDDISSIRSLKKHIDKNNFHCLELKDGKLNKM